MDSKNLKHKAVSGVLWTSIQRFMTIFIQFISGIVLARLLTPYDYGCIGMLSIFMLVATSFIDGGFGSALIQKKRPTQDDYSTIFYWNFGMSVAVYFVLYLTAPAISDFYHLPILCNVLRVQGLVLIINALSFVQINQLNKNFKFKKISIITLSSSLISLGITIWMAYRGFGVWALVAQNLLMAALPMLAYWFTTKWWPSLVFSWESFKSLFSFGFYMFLTTMTSTIANNIQGLLIGRFYNSSTLGFYSKANSTEKLASTSISQVIGQVSYPLYAELQNSRDKLISTIKKLTMSVSYITFPLMLLLIILAEPLFELLYSSRWLPAVPYFQFLCIAGLAICLQSVNSQSISAIGKSKAMFTWSFVKQTVGIGFMIVGFFIWGIWGLLIGMVMKSYLIYVVNASLVSYYIGYKLRTQLFDILPVLILSVISFGIGWLTAYFLNFNHYLDSVLGALAFIIVYFGASKLLNLEAMNIVSDLLGPFLKKFSKKKPMS